MNIVRKAINIAFASHGTTMRKNKRDLFLIHPVRVASIVEKCARGDEQIIAAAYLHDTIEDTNYTIEKMRKDFGNDIAAIVEAVTEEEEIGEDKKATWLDRKAESLEKLKKAPQEVLMVRGADLIDNVLSLRDEFESEGNSFWKKFNASPLEKLGHYQKIARIIYKRSDNNILKDILENIFGILRSLEEDVKYWHDDLFYSVDSC